MLTYREGAWEKRSQIIKYMKQLDDKLGQCLAVSAEVKSVVCIPPDMTDHETAGDDKISLLGIAEAAGLLPMMSQSYITHAAIRKLRGELPPDPVRRYLEPTVNVRLVDGPIYLEFMEKVMYLNGYAEEYGFDVMTYLASDRGFDFTWHCKKRKHSTSPFGDAWHDVIFGGLNYSGPKTVEEFNADEYRQKLNNGNQPRFWSTNT